MSLFTVMLGAATYGLVRLYFPRWSALGASLLVIGGPQIAFWGRQVMLDVPAHAVIVAGRQWVSLKFCKGWIADLH